MHGCSPRSLSILLFQLLSLTGCCATATGLDGRDRFVTRGEIEQLIHEAIHGGDSLAAASLLSIQGNETSNQKNMDLVRQVRDALETSQHPTSSAPTQQLLRSLQMIDRAIEISIGNLANARTVGYQRRVIHIRDDGANFDVNLDPVQGILVGTEKDFDLTIEGAGFFVVRLPDRSLAYTRAGNFFINRDGELVLGNNEGLPLDPAVNIGESGLNMAVTSDGVITGVLPGEATRTEFGTLQIARFVNPEKLEAKGSFLRETTASGPPLIGDPNEGGRGSILQRTLEYSNVDPLAEMRQILILRRWSRTIAKALELP